MVRLQINAKSHLILKSSSQTIMHENKVLVNGYIHGMTITEDKLKTQRLTKTLTSGNPEAKTAKICDL